MSAESTNTIANQPFIELKSVDSTNNYAMQMVKNDIAKHGAAYFAYEQTAGKGQRNNQWLSAKGENIILSIVLEPKQFVITQKFYLNVITALAVKDLFNNYSTKTFKIKWTNDIYFGDRKAAGILIENIIAGNIITFSVAGFGVNVNQTNFDACLKNPVSLKQITGKDYDIVMLAKELRLLLQTRYFQLENNEKKILLNEYNQHLYKRNEIVRFKKNNEVFKGKVIEVDEAGRLIIEHINIKEAFEFGSIEWIIE